jgi:protein-tyrosine phosphatase
MEISISVTLKQRRIRSLLEVFKFLWIELKISAILTCAKGYQVNHSKNLIPHYKYIPAEDKDSYDLTVHFDEAVNFIKDMLSQTNVNIILFQLLVHCIAGVSRSVSMVLAYLIR